jgi:F0F1-type ATP synthase epsilon subunit
MGFQCVIVTPEHQVLDENILQAILPAHDGLMGILTDRAPLLVKLGLSSFYDRLRDKLQWGARKF